MSEVYFSSAADLASAAENGRVLVMFRKKCSFVLETQSWTYIICLHWVVR